MFKTGFLIGFSVFGATGIVFVGQIIKAAAGDPFWFYIIGGLLLVFGVYRIVFDD